MRPSTHPIPPQNDTAMTATEFLDAYHRHRQARAQLPPGPVEAFTVRGAELHGVTFDQAIDLSGAVFIDCRFRQCNFLQADLFAVSADRAHFSECIFDAVNMNKSRLERAVFEGCWLRSAHFLRADLSGALFRSGRLSVCDFRRAQLLDAEFHGCRVDDECDFSDADLEGALFSECGGFEPLSVVQ